MLTHTTSKAPDRPVVPPVPAVAKHVTRAESIHQEALALIHRAHEDMIRRRYPDAAAG